MHISEGVLSPPVLIAGAVLSLAGTAYGLKKLHYDRLILTGVLASAFFIASLIHVPIGPVSAHLILNGLVGALLGWAAFPAILTGLLLQSLLFQYGGITALGVNAFNMAFPAVLCYLLFRTWFRVPKRRGLAAFLCGALSVFLAGLFTAASLAFTDQGFFTTAKYLLFMHLPVMVVEGLVTMFAVSFLIKVRPEMLDVPEESAI